MPYEIVLSPQAEDDYFRRSPELQNYLDQQLLRLAGDPVRLSRRSVFPYPSHCQLFVPSPVELDEVRHEFTILFRYGQDENTIQIVGIGHIER